MRSAAIIVVLALSACEARDFKSSSPIGVPAATPMQTLVERATGTDYVADTILPDLLVKPVLVQPSEINLAIDRGAFLREVFRKVVSGRTDQQRVESWVRFLQDRIAHPREVTVHPNGVMLIDPVWILTNRIAQCGQTNRILVDGLTAVGYRARTVHLSSHVAAEVWYDDSWHFVDADWLNNGQFVRKPDGTLPSTAEIYSHPEWLRSIDQNSEFRDYPADIGWSQHRKYDDMFVRVDLGNGILTPFYLTKTATLLQERDLTFGWDYYKVETE